MPPDGWSATGKGNRPVFQFHEPRQLLEFTQAAFAVDANIRQRCSKRSGGLSVETAKPRICFFPDHADTKMYIGVSEKASVVVLLPAMALALPANRLNTRAVPDVAGVN